MHDRPLKQVMPHHHMQHVSNVGPNLLTHNENRAYVMPGVTADAVMSCMHCMAHTCRQASHPYENMACQKLLVDMPFMPAELYLIKSTTSHFSTLNMNCKPECVKNDCTMRTRLNTMRTSGYVQRNP